MAETRIRSNFCFINRTGLAGPARPLSDGRGMMTLLTHAYLLTPGSAPAEARQPPNEPSVALAASASLSRSLSRSLALIANLPTPIKWFSVASTSFQSGSLRADFGRASWALLRLAPWARTHRMRVDTERGLTAPSAPPGRDFWLAEKAAPTRARSECAQSLRSSRSRGSARSGTPRAWRCRPSCARCAAPLTVWGPGPPFGAMTLGPRALPEWPTRPK